MTPKGHFEINWPLGQNLKKCFWDLLTFRYICKSNDHLFVPIWIVDLRGKGSVYRKIFWARLWSPISISWPLGQEIEKLEIGLAQKIFRYTDPFPLRSPIHIGANMQSFDFYNLTYTPIFYLNQKTNIFYVLLSFKMISNFNLLTFRSGDWKIGDRPSPEDFSIHGPPSP